MAKLKKPKEAWFNEFGKGRGYIEGERVIVTHEYFYNGEGHYKGYYKNNPKKTFDIPDVFFMDAELEQLLKDIKQ